MPLTDVHNMALSIDHDIPVMPILDLQDVTCHRICGHRLNEVKPGFLELECVGVPISRHEERKQVVDLCSTHFVSRRRVRHDIYHSTLMQTTELSDTVRRLKTRVILPQVP